MIRANLLTGETRDFDLDWDAGAEEWHRFRVEDDRLHLIRALSVVIKDGRREAGQHVLARPQVSDTVWWEAELIREGDRVLRECAICYFGTMRTVLSVYRRSSTGLAFARIDTSRVGRLRFRPS